LLSLAPWTPSVMQSGSAFMNAFLILSRAEP